MYLSVASPLKGELARVLAAALIVAVVGRHELVPVHAMDLPPEMSQRQRNEGKTVKPLSATQDPLEGKRIELQWEDGLFYDATIGKRQKKDFIVLHLIPMVKRLSTTSTAQHGQK